MGKKYHHLSVDQHQNAILTLVERSTDFCLMHKIANKQAKTVSKMVWRLLLPYKKKVLTITTDNGSEFAEHEWITKHIGAKVYFTDSFSSWQKGNIENTNKLIRQYIPKDTDFRKISDGYLTSIQTKINRRPREKLKFNTPKCCFFKNFT